MKKVLIVDGMMCAHCQMHVQKALADVDGVEKAEVDLEKKRATVSLSKEVSDQMLMQAVTDAGYTQSVVKSNLRLCVSCKHSVIKVRAGGHIRRKKRLLWIQTGS